MLHVEVLYGHADKQSIISVVLQEAATVFDAIQASQILSLWPEINLEQQKVGIFSKIVTLDTAVKNLDRIEIYRPLTIDPKDARTLRTKNKK
jgi:hypothetical protein